MKKTLSISILILTAITGVFLYPKINRYVNRRPPENADALRKEIMASIKRPFGHADTLVLQTVWLICGNSDPDELPIDFDIQLGKDANKNKLSSNLNLCVLTTKDFNKMIDTISKYKYGGDYPTNLSDSCRVGKISADIRAEKLSSIKVRLQERYYYNDTSKYIQKDFTYNGGKWTFAITDSSTHVN